MRKNFIVFTVSLLLLISVTTKTSITSAYKYELGLVVPSVVRWNEYQEHINGTETTTQKICDFYQYSVEKHWYDPQLAKKLFLIGFVFTIKDSTTSWKILLLSNGSYISPPVYDRLQTTKDGITTDILLTFNYSNICDKLGRPFREEATITYNGQSYKLSEINETHPLWKYAEYWYNFTIEISPHETLFAIPPKIELNQRISNYELLPNGTLYNNVGYVKEYTTIQVGSTAIDVIHVQFPAKSIETTNSKIELPLMDIYYHKGSGILLKRVITYTRDSIQHYKDMVILDPYYINIGNETYSKNTIESYRIITPINTIMAINIAFAIYLSNHNLKRKNRRKMRTVD